MYDISWQIAVATDETNRNYSIQTCFLKYVHVMFQCLFSCLQLYSLVQVPTKIYTMYVSKLNRLGIICFSYTTCVSNIKVDIHSNFIQLFDNAST